MPSVIDDIIGHLSGDANAGDVGQVSLRNISEQGRQAMTDLLKLLIPTAGSSLTDFSKEAAIKDSQGAIDSIFKKYKETDLPNIFQAQGSSGGYNTTTGKLLANDAFARATAEGAKVQLDTISKYDENRNRDLSSLINLLQTDRGSETTGYDFRNYQGPKESDRGGSGIGDIIGSFIGDIFGI